MKQIQGSEYVSIPFPERLGSAQLQPHDSNPKCDEQPLEPQPTASKSLWNTHQAPIEEGVCQVTAAAEASVAFPIRLCTAEVIPRHVADPQTPHSIINTARTPKLLTPMDPP